MRSLILWFVFAACTSPARVHVNVEVYGATGAPVIAVGSPVQGAVIAFRDRDDTSRSAKTDSDGKASGEVEPGGSVWCSPGGDLLMQGTNLLFAFDDVQAGDTLVFGASAKPSPPIATMTVTTQAPPPPPSPVFHPSVSIYTSCTLKPSDDGVIQLDESCGSTVDILAVAVYSYRTGNVMYGPYQYLPAQPIIDGGTIAVPPTAWLPFDTASVQVTNLDGAMLSGKIGTLGFTADTVMSGDTLTAQLPKVGTALQVAVDLSTPAGRQSITAVVPASASTLDVHAAGAPYVTMDGLQTPHARWSYDDLKGVLRADAMVTTYGWGDNKTCQEGNIAIVVRSPTAAGPLPALALPVTFGCAQPRSDLVISEQVALVRATSEGFDPLQAAMLGRAPALGVGDSFAISRTQ